MRRLRVVTWNVGRLYTPTHNNRLDDDDVPRVAAAIDELDPDAVLLQELVTPRQLAHLLARLPHLDGELARACRYDRHVAVLVRRGHAPRFEQHVLEPTGRGLVAARFQAGGRTVAVHAVHLDVFRREGRRSQAEAIAQVVARREESLVVVAGDFNLDPALAARLGNQDDLDTFALLGERMHDGGREAGPTLMGVLRVDHVLVRGAPASALRTVVVAGRRLPLGDHDPVVCDVELHAAEASETIDATQPGP